MVSADDEDERLRSVALQNAQSILLARQRAEEELVRAKEALERKTQELASSLAMSRATLEATTDGILVTDSKGVITDYNAKFVAMWRLTREVMETRQHKRVIDVTSTRFAEPEQFFARIKEIYATAPPETHDLLELADGTVVERSSRIQFIEQRNVGRVWSFRDITDQRRAEEAVRKQSEWLRVTLTSIGDAVITTDGEGRVTSMNPMAERLTGWTQRDALGLRLNGVFQIVREETRAPADNPVFKALQENKTVGLANHTVLIGKDGTEYAIDDSAAPIRDDRGHVIGAVLIFRDITQRRREDKALRESETQFRQIAESMPQIVFTAHPDGSIDYYNQKWYDYTGFERNSPADQSWQSILHPDDVQRGADTYAHSINSGDLYEIEYRFKDRRTGGFRWFLCRATPVRNVLGKIVRWFGTCTDIHDTKRAEETTRFLADASATLAELTDYETMLQRVANLAVPSFADWCAVDMQEPDGSIRRLAVTHVDPTKVELAHEVFRRYPPTFFDEFGTGRVLRTGEPAWLGTIPDSVLEEAAQDEGHLKTIRELGLKSYISMPLRSRAKTVGVVSFVTAESGRVYDARDVAAAQDLANRATIAIENAHLLAALREADRRKDEFLAMLAHELRNPLAPIINAVQILRQTAAPVPELKWATDVIDRQVQHTVRLVDDLMDVSRITRGKIGLRKERVTLQSVVNSAVEASRPLIEKRGHDLTVSVPSEPIHLDADLTRLAQVFLNLLNNAAKYTEPGGRISMSAQRDDGHVMIRVKDTGVGIQTEMLPHIFGLFTQVDRSLERTQGGLGIGLTLVERLVDMHGGSVEAYSAGLGEGSEFVVRLPIAE